MKKVIVSLKYSVIAHPKEKVFSVEYYGLQELKQEFLKRFGNIRATNKLDKQKPKVKELTYKAETLEEWMELIQKNTDYKLEIKFTESGN